MSEYRTLSHVVRVQTPRNLVCVVISSWDVGTVQRERKGGRPAKVERPQLHPRSRR